MVHNTHWSDREMTEEPQKTAISDHDASEDGWQLLVSKSEFARMRGVSRRAVYKAIESGRIVAGVAPDGRIDPLLADKLWRENTDPSRGGRQERESISMAEALEIFHQCGERGEVPPIHVSRAALLHFRTELLRLELGEKKGELVEAAKVEAQAFKAARNCRDAVLAIPDRLSAELAGISDVATVRAKLRREFENALAPLEEPLSYGGERLRM